jgi:hypothetical protein
VKVTLNGTPLARRYDIQTVTRTGLEWGLVGPFRGSQCSLLAAIGGHWLFVDPFCDGRVTIRAIDY